MVTIINHYNHKKNIITIINIVTIINHYNFCCVEFPTQKSSLFTKIVPPPPEKKTVTSSCDGGWALKSCASTEAMVMAISCQGYRLKCLWRLYCTIYIYIYSLVGMYRSWQLLARDHINLHCRPSWWGLTWGLTWGLEWKTLWVPTTYLQTSQTLP